MQKHRLQRRRIDRQIIDTAARRPHATEHRRQLAPYVAHCGVQQSTAIERLTPVDRDRERRCQAQSHLPLRADGLLDKLLYLHYGLAFILGFIAVKLVLHASHGYGVLTAIPEPDIPASLLVIIGTMIVTVLASMWGTRRRKKRSEGGEGTDDESGTTGNAFE